MLLRSIKRRLGLILVVGGSALGAGAVTGSSFVAAAAAIAATVGAVVFWDRKKPRRETTGQSDRARGAPYSASYRWEVERSPDLTVLLEALGERGLEPSVGSQSPTRIEAKGGSQLRTRLLGGHFVDPKQLPVEVELEAAQGQDDGKGRVELEVRDRFGIAVRDEALEERFIVAAEQIRDVVQERLFAASDSGDGSASVT